MYYRDKKNDMLLTGIDVKIHIIKHDKMGLREGLKKIIFSKNFELLAQ